MLTPTMSRTINADMKNIGTILRSKREQAGLSQFALAVKAHVSPDYVSRVELGKCTNTGIETLNKLATALGVRMVDLLDSPQDCSGEISKIGGSNE